MRHLLVRVVALIIGAHLSLYAGPAAAAPNAKASRLYEDALTRYEKKDFSGAIVQLKNALQIDNSMLPAHVLFGRALMGTGQVASAEVEFGEALRLGVNRAEVVLPLARSVIEQGRQKEVIDQPGFQLAGLPMDVQSQLLLLKAGAWGDLGDERSALQAVQDARAADPSSIDAWLAEVPIRIRARQFAEAMAAADKAAAMDPNSADMFYQRGSILHAQGDLRAAQADYDKALAANPDLADARVTRAGIAVDEQRYADAAKDVAELLRRTPLEPRGWYLSALLAERDGRKPDMKAALLKITSLLDPVPLAYIRYRLQLLLLDGQAHFGLGEREKAAPYFKYFQQVQPVTPVSKMLASIYLSERNYDGAIEALDQYVRATPKDAQALSLMAAAQLAKGHDAVAASLMQEALRNSDAPALHTAFGLSLMGSGRAASGQAELESAFAKDPGQTEAGFALVAIYLRERQAARALSVANAMASRQPQNAGIQNLLGLVKGQAHDVIGARAAFAQAAKLDPTLVQARLNLARLEINANNPDQAQSILNSVLATDDHNTEAIFEMAVLWERRGQLDEAQRWLQKGFDVGGPDLRPGLALVDLQMRRGRLDDAMKMAKQVSARAPDDLRVLLALARAQLANGDQAGSRTTLTAATLIAGFDAPVQTEVALLQVAARNLTGAAYCLDKALSAQPAYLPAQSLAVEVQWRQGDFAKAELGAQQIVKAEPKLALGYNLLGDVALARDQPATAIEAYRRAYQVQPSSYTLTRLFNALERRDAGAALQLVAAWVKSHPGDAIARKLLAQAYAQSNDLGAARREYEQLRGMLPKDADVLNDLANVMLRSNDPQAQAVAEQALALAPDRFMTIDTAGWAAYKAGKLDRSLELLRDARLRNPESSEVRYHLAATLMKIGRRDEARKELQAALRLESKFQGRDDAESLLRTLE